MDTREAQLSGALELGVDTLTLQSRALAAMLSVDKRRARELLCELSPKPAIPTLDCESALIYDVSVFYDTLAKVADGSFSSLEKKQGKHVAFIEPYVAGITSPAQVGPAAKLITALDLSPAQKATVVYAFIGAVKKIPEDDRSFSASILHDALVQQLQALLEAGERQEQLRYPLLESVRDYLLRNIAGRRCAENVSGKRQQHLLDFIGYVSRSLAGANSLPASELKSAGAGGRMQTHSYWQSPRAQTLFSKMRRLYFNAADVRYTEAEKEGVEWQDRLAEVINDIGGWVREGDETSGDLFHQKCMLLQALIDITPEGDRRDELVERYNEALRNTGDPVLRLSAGLAGLLPQRVSGVSGRATAL